MKKNNLSNKDRLNEMNKKDKFKKKIITFSVIILVLIGFYFLISNSNSQKFSSPHVDKSKVPKGAIHWHPKLTILIDGVKQEIRSNIGISSAKHEQTHTHDTDGIIHLENPNPQLNPETLSLGYFFKIWRKPFNSTCILDKCTNIDDGTLKFSVNGKENFEYENYIMQENSNMLIEYSSNK